MKILRIITTVNPESGGPIEGLKQQAKIAMAKGHTTEVACFDEENATHVKEFPLRVHALGPIFSKYAYSRKFKPWLLANYNQYDAIVIHNLWQYHSFAAHAALKSVNAPYYVFTHGALDPWFKKQYPLKHLKKCLYWFWGEYPVIRDAKKVLFTCEEEKVLARQSFWPYRCNEHVVNYGTAGHIGIADEQRSLFLNSFPNLRGKRFLLFLSRIHPKKGIDLLIEAFAKNKPYESDLELVIAGPDQIGWQKELHALAVSRGVADKITWTGMLGGDMKWGAYLTADAFILPSHAENFGIVVAEALSCSLPVLISDKVNIWQEVEQNVAGLVADDTIGGCSDLIERWIQMDESAKSQIRENAKQCFMTHFEINAAVDSLMAVFAQGVK
ncbi:glycosyltransferase [Methylomonas sp. ZR1]|nr:glycosyltransferase [Methylomonas sp. ZR1]